MLDINFIRENKEKIQYAIEQKKCSVDLEKLLQIDKERKEAQKTLDELRGKRNELAGKMGNKKPDQEQIKEGKRLKEKAFEKEEQLKQIESEFKDLAKEIPNVISPDTPEGKDEDENVVLRKYGEPNKFDFKPKDHMEIGRELGIIDTEKSAEISGARFNYLFGEAVLLQMALLQFVFETLTSREIISELAQKTGNPSDKPFKPVLPPVMVKSEIMKKMDRFDPIEDKYFLEKDDILLVGSAEHSMGPLHMNETLKEEDLPIRYIGYSTAFRREAGSYGKDTAGILRRHQFDKAEMETFSLPEQGEKEQDLIVTIQEYLCQKLELPHQVVAICTGDMGKPDYRQIDIECFLPGQNKYRETHTSDYMTDFQSRRLNIKYKKNDGEKGFAHMNDATAFAMGRILIAVLENYQQKDGSVKVPEVLKKYMPGNISEIGKR
jgi:seryl-tRNA synthetase